MGEEYNRRAYLKRAGVGVIATAGLAGCAGNGSSNGSDSGSGSGSDSDSDSGNGEDQMHFAIISGVGGFGDQAFNDLALQGLNKAADELGATVNKVQSTDTGEYGTLQSRLAESTDPDYDLIVLVSNFHGSALQENAAEYSDQKWMIINQGLFKENGEHFENVGGYLWANHQMSFQAGVVAGTMTSRNFSAFESSTDPSGKTVGFVGGRDTNFINAFEEAYRGGAQWVDDEVEVLAGYAGSFSDPAAGNEVATSQLDSGADIVYHASAGTGPGVIEATANAGRFALGSDADQSVTLSEFSEAIMGSAVKYINVGTYQVATGLANGNWDEVNGKHVLGLDSDAVELVLGQDVGPELPDVVSENLAEAKEGIINGDITVPCNADGC
jgi:basic membrane protein A